MQRLILLLALVLAAFASPALAQDFPARPDGPVYDAADLLPAAEEETLAARLTEYNLATGNAVVVATEPTTGGRDIDLYSRDLAEYWDIGGAESEKGVLVYIARDDRQMAIKTARGVQGVLTDISAGRIIRDTMRPAFRQGDFPGGINGAVDQIIERLAMDPVDAAAIAEAEAASEAQRETEGSFPLGGFIWLAFIFFFFILPMLRGGRKARRYSRGPWGDAARDIILWEVGKAVVRGLEDGGRGGGWGGGGGFGGGGGGGFGGFGGGGGGFNGGGASGGW
ncbi:methanol dehydrogenase [Erythrobacter gaetbuli]|uniref:Methanol dehydrogenase n=1 Tax=Qipengyuania gaetbuli TaxID=266952 RepID=A0A844XVW4_9SPHN|nr:TPM domain-containing protein [Qipengyuania gaetbuli]MXO50000.1 methanol dehydrogenase [Qipengyuania gaetbuli]